MKKLLYILLLTALMPALTFAQKAYQRVDYRGSVENMRIDFSLANGYPSASFATLANPKLIKRQMLMAAGDVGLKRELRLDEKVADSKATTKYIVIEEVEAIFMKPPTTLKAKYYADGKSVSFI